MLGMFRYFTASIHPHSGLMIRPATRSLSSSATLLVRVNHSDDRPYKEPKEWNSRQPRSTPIRLNPRPTLKPRKILQAEEFDPFALSKEGVRKLVSPSQVEEKFNPFKFTRSDKRNLEAEEKEEEEDINALTPAPPPPTEPEQPLTEVKESLTDTIYAYHFLSHITAEEIYSYFSTVGPIKEITFLKPWSGHKTKGVVIKYVEKSDAEKAANSLDQVEWMKSKIGVLVEGERFEILKVYPVPAWWRVSQFEKYLQNRWMGRLMFSYMDQQAGFAAYENPRITNDIVRTVGPGGTKRPLKILGKQTIFEKSVSTQIPEALLARKYELDEKFRKKT